MTPLWLWSYHEPCVFSSFISIYGFNKYFCYFQEFGCKTERNIESFHRIHAFHTFDIWSLTKLRSMRLPCVEQWNENPKKCDISKCYIKFRDSNSDGMNLIWFLYDNRNYGKISKSDLTAVICGDLMGIEQNGMEQKRFGKISKSE